MGAASGPRVRAQKPRSAVVLVEDRALRSAVVGLLEDLAWRVHAVDSFRDAQSAIEGEQPGVLLVEPGLSLDVLDGFVRTLDDRAGVPGVVIVSDQSRAADIASAHQVVFVREPFDLDELEEALERARYSDAEPRWSKASSG